MQKYSVRAYHSILGPAAVAAAVLVLAVAGPASAEAAHAAPRAGEVTASAAAAADPGKRIVVSLQQKRLWLLQRGDTVFTAPIAIGSGQVFRFGNRTYRFETPRGERRILGKDFEANWIPPDWHYYRKAAYRGLEPVHLKDGDRIELSDGTFLEVRDMQVGRINQWDNWWPFTPGTEIMFDGKIFIPPFGSPQRVIPNALGPVKLLLGDGYLIHGTHDYNHQSIGTAASAGCIRMRNPDVEKLAGMVDVGTPVYIY
jgi:hypothetical protein